MPVESLTVNLIDATHSHKVAILLGIEREGDTASFPQPKRQEILSLIGSAEDYSCRSAFRGSKGFSSLKMACRSAFRRGAGGFSPLKIRLIFRVFRPGYLPRSARLNQIQL